MKAYKFKGGVWMGMMSYTWPFGRLEINEDNLVISIEGLPFYNKKIEHCFTHENLEKIEIKKYIPFMAYGISITSNDKKIESPVYFWSLQLGKLITALREFNWIK